jgi:transcriptional regulator with XRE-family HTH domain
MELKHKLQLLMARRGLNGQKLARLSKVSDSEISRILQGKSRPGLDNALRLAQAVGTSLDYLADDAIETEPAKPDEAVSSDERKLLEVCQKIGRSEVLGLLEIVRLLGYEVAMARLVNARPVVEPNTLAAEARSTHATPAPHAARTAVTAGASA